MNKQKRLLVSNRRNQKGSIRKSLNHLVNLVMLKRFTPVLTTRKMLDAIPEKLSGKLLPLIHTKILVNPVTSQDSPKSYLTAFDMLEATSFVEAMD